MYLRLWALGRTASVEQLKSGDPFLKYVSAGDVPLPREPLHEEEYGDDAPHPSLLSKDEVAECMLRRRAMRLRMRALTVLRFTARMGGFSITSLE